MPYTTRRYQKQTTPTLNIVPTETKLPLDKPVANYYRQSSEGQIGNVSTTMQTVNMPAYLERLGWNRDSIIMIDMDAGVSGTTKIDEREGMSMLFGLITQGAIGAVACQDEDRLFRDVTQIQVNIFLEACKRHNVLVITPSMVYDFAHRTYGSFHARQFRFKSEMAADYIETVVLGRLYSARRNLFLEGRWGGCSMPTGYMVDMRKKLPDGSKNENLRKYVVFEPYAMVIREYFRLFLSFSGNLAKTLFHIRANGPYYPDPALCPLPEGYKTQQRFQQNKHGRCPHSVATLANMFTNIIYIGHFTFRGEIIRWNNHPPLIDEDTFFKAYNYLSATDLEGNKNPYFTPDKRSHRPNKEAKREVDYPLLAGLIVSEWEGRWKTVGTNWREQWHCYQYAFFIFDGVTQPLWRKKADFIDESVTSLMLERLESTFDLNKWEIAAQSFHKRFDEEKRLKEAQLQQLQTVMENFIASLASLTTPQLVAEVEKRYQQAQAEYQRLHLEVDAIKSEELNTQRLRKLLSSVSDVITKWDKTSADEKRALIRIFIDKIEATRIDIATISLKICWQDQSSDTLRIGKITTLGKSWLPREITRLVELIESGASKVEVAKAFPNRTWYTIYRKYKDTKKNWPVSRYEGTIRRNETYNDYVARVGSTDTLCISSDNLSPSTILFASHRFM